MLDLLNIIKEGTKAVPAVRYALGVAGVIAVVALVGTFNIDPKVGIIGTILVFGFMTLLVVFAKLASARKEIFFGPIKLLMWASVILFIATAALLFTAAFFRFPTDLNSLFSSKEQTAILPDTKKDVPEFLDPSISNLVEVTLHELQGEAIDYLLDTQSVRIIWRDLHNAKPILSRSLTPIIDSLLFLKEKYSILVPSKDLDIERVGNFQASKELLVSVEGKHKKISDLRLPKRFLPGTNPNLSLDFFLPCYGLDEAVNDYRFNRDCIGSFISAMESESGKEISCFSWLSTEALNSISFDKAIYNTGYPQDKFYNSLGFYKFYQYIFRNYLPNNFIKLMCTYKDVGCSFNKDEFIVRFTTPLLRVGVISIINHNNFPITITKVSLKETICDSVRTFENDAQLPFKHIKQDNRLILNQNESFVIPIYISLVPFNKFKNEGDLMDNADWGKLKEGVLFGPRYFMDSLFVNGKICFTDTNQSYTKKTQVRVAIASDGLFLMPYSGGASCPFLFQQQNADYKSIGTLITGNNSKSRERWDTIQLKKSTNHFQIRELEDETSYLNCIYLQYRDTVKNTTQIFYVDDPKLNKDDMEYLQIEKGDVVVLKFRVPEKQLFNEGRLFVISKGFYLEKTIKRMHQKE